VKADPISVALAVGVALAAALLVADIVARLVDAGLRAITPNVDRRQFIDRPRRIVRLVIFLITTAALLLPALRYAGVKTNVGSSPEALAQWGLRQGLRIAFVAVAAYFVIRIGSAAALRFEAEMSAGTGLDVIERRKRAQTLSRILQKTLTAVVIPIAALMVLRELDVDTSAILTGAGIVGLAVGFGAQTLVRDVISGFFLILEDQVRVGDVAVVNGQGGLIEEVNLRTIVLRDEEGTVHVFPNGEVKTLANKSKDFSYFVLSVPLPLEQDPDAVSAAIRDAADSVAQDDAFKPHILAPFELYGMVALEPGQYTVKGRIKTVPLKQWTVGRELLARIAATLKARGIDLPKPTMNVSFETPLSLNAPPPDRTL
jgi:small conductance mechanosensitive channel